MPLGRDSIKRVKNNGYSRVTTTAPDMENSSVVEPIDVPIVVIDIPVAEPVKEPKKAAKKKSEPKQTEKKEPAKNPAAKKKSEPKAAAKKQTESGPTTKTKRGGKKPLAPSKDIPTPTEVAETVRGKEPEGYITLGGGELPIYLL